MYAPTRNAEDAEAERFYEDLLELTPKKRCLFHYRGLECNSRKSRNTWVTGKFGLRVQNEAGQRLIKFCQENATGHSKHPLPTTQKKTLHMDSTRCQYWNQIDYILCSQRWRSSIQSAKTRLGVDCGSDHELLLAKIRLKSKKVGETTRPFRHNLNQIPYDYTVEVRNRFKGLDLIDRVPEELWVEVCDIVQKAVIKTIPKKKKCKKAK